jgi:hypothetical protein
MPKTYWAQRIENGLIVGMPDVHLATRREQYWIELKSFNAPSRHTTHWMGIGGGKGQIRQEQVNWHIKAHSMNIKSFILAKISGENYLVPNKAIKDIHKYCHDDWNCYRIPSWDSLWSILS